MAQPRTFIAGLVVVAALPVDRPDQMSWNGINPGPEPTQTKPPPDGDEVLQDAEQAGTHVITKR